LLRGVILNFVSYCIFLSCEAATIVTVFKATGKFTTCGTRLISVPVASALPSFTIAICVGSLVIGGVLDDVGLSDGIADGSCFSLGGLSEKDGCRYSSKS
jgi:hypothetical protein